MTDRYRTLSMFAFIFLLSGPLAAQFGQQDFYNNSQICVHSPDACAAVDLIDPENDYWAPYAEKDYKDKAYRSRKDLPYYHLLRTHDTRKTQDYLSYCHPGFAFRAEEDFNTEEYIEYLAAQCKGVVKDLNTRRYENRNDFDYDFIGLAELFLGYQPKLRSTSITQSVRPSSDAAIKELVAIARYLAENHGVTITIKEHNGIDLHKLDPEQIKIGQTLSLRVPPANVVNILNYEFYQASRYYWTTLAFIDPALGEEQRRTEFTRVLKLLHLLHPLENHRDLITASAVFTNRLADSLFLARRLTTYYMPYVLEHSQEAIFNLQQQEHTLLNWYDYRIRYWLAPIAARTMLFKQLFPKKQTLPIDLNAED